jgi:hypothetical protein
MIYKRDEIVSYLESSQLPHKAPSRSRKDEELLPMELGRIAL